MSIGVLKAMVRVTTKLGRHCKILGREDTKPSSNTRHGLSEQTSVE